MSFLRMGPAKAIEYCLGRWAALTRYLKNGDLPIDNNHVQTASDRARSAGLMCG
jgi:hypothetical protein